MYTVFMYTVCLDLSPTPTHTSMHHNILLHLHTYILILIHNILTTGVREQKRCTVQCTVCTVRAPRGASCLCNTA
jgi:hypothetical protein